MRFRFQVVASAFHKGRIKIVYDPYLLASASVGEYNVNYVHVCDLASERDFTIDFGWGQEVPWLKVLDLPTARSYYPAGSQLALLTTPGPSIGANGLFSVIVVNELTSVSAEVPGVTVNVFVSAGDDFEVCVPACEHMANLSWSPGIRSGGGPGGVVMSPQMGDDSDPVDTQTESAPMQETTDTLAPPLSTKDHTLDVFFGDPVVSFRQCLKRYQFSRAWQPTYNTNTGFVYWTLVVPDVPIYPGAVGGAIDLALNDSSEETPWNYSVMTLLNYLLPAFAARRGGLRWKHHLQGITNAPSSFAATREGEQYGYSSTLNQPQAWSNTEPYVAAQNAFDFFPNTWCATHVTDVRNNPVLEVELPYYYGRRFYICRDTNMTDTGRLSTSYHKLTAHVNMGPYDNPTIVSYVATAEDFNLYFFCGVPPLFLVSEPPAVVI